MNNSAIVICLQRTTHHVRKPALAKQAGISNYRAVIGCPDCSSFFLPSVGLLPGENLYSQQLVPPASRPRSKLGCNQIPFIRTAQETQHTPAFAGSFRLQAQNLCRA